MTTKIFEYSGTDFKGNLVIVRNLKQMDKTCNFGFRLYYLPIQFSTPSSLRHCIINKIQNMVYM